ncbi:MULTISPECIES: COX15/CtaA family protein [Myroides]|uniref:Heme A synthase n=1 Tax=Myroides albus TaxID=2562892 RepID=A0A6I3LQC7_9FLAO|nr:MULTISPECIES: COX15/CtaA family protein [Myroides]MTG98332.1 heme A synthase [Myroides albus]MVX36083.1 heme A synthase [Myroides sp. LoEW2-1]UVD79595.1 COX15/CtaA family protein [Myroides albus]
MKNYFLPFAKASLILVYLVIFAGAAVRMTGSGMGCPDWPKCFGYYIPPTDVEVLQWQPDRQYEKGQMIIHDDSLWKAKEDFTTTSEYNEVHWEKYTKHDYAEFNPNHTWTEYINRLCGALAGLACLAMAIASFSYWKERKSITLASWLVVALMVFQAWLGAVVVYSVLNPIKITVHMVMALVIVAIIISIIHACRCRNEEIRKYHSSFKTILIVSLIFTLVQTVLGTQVREFIDEKIQAGIGNEHLWLNMPNIEFYIHRSFSFLILAVNIYLFYTNRKYNLGFDKMKWVMILLILEVFTGVLMNYLHFPFGSQTAHLVLASILFGVQFKLILEARKCYYCGRSSED